MIADVNLPDFETRIAILNAKCKEKDYPLSADIVSVIANNIQSNVRELEGALNRITAFHQLNNTSPSTESVKNILSSVSSYKHRDRCNYNQTNNKYSGFLF